MRTQSRDTSLEIVRFQIAGLRSFAPAQKFGSVRSISASMFFSTLHTCAVAPNESELARQYVSHYYPATLSAAFRAAAPTSAEWAIQPFDLHYSLTRVIAALNHAAIAHALMGSSACGIYGFPVGVSMLDVIIDVQEEQIPALIKRLRRRQVVVERGWRKTLHREKLLRFLSLQSLVRINLTVHNEAPYDKPCFSRARRVVLDEQFAPVSVVAPEDCIIQGLVDFHKTGNCDDALYNNLLGIVKIQQPDLDFKLLHTLADKLKLQDVLSQLLNDADVEDNQGDHTVQFS